MTLALHTFRHASLLSEARQCLADTMKPGACSKFDWGKLEKKPLLLSMYAETLRFGVQIHIPRSASHRELSIGNMLIPKNQFILVNTWLAHTDEAIWNTKEDAFPLNSFWAQRFLIDPEDASSGPTKKKLWSHEKAQTGEKNTGDVHFSMGGLEGAWIPYGGMDLYNMYTSLTCHRWTPCPILALMDIHQYKQPNCICCRKFFN
jgi:Cytochrome P450